jgi:hypothetical protein
MRRNSIVALAALMITVPAMAHAASERYLCGHYKRVSDSHRVGSGMGREMDERARLQGDIR